MIEQGRLVDFPAAASPWAVLLGFGVLEDPDELVGDPVDREGLVDGIAVGEQRA